MKIFYHTEICFQTHFDPRNPKIRPKFGKLTFPESVLAFFDVSLQENRLKKRYFEKLISKY